MVQTAGGGGIAHHGKGHGSSSLGAHVGVLQGIEGAQEVRDQILAAVKRTRGAGLGDERLQAPAATIPGSSASGLSVAHLAVLREIRASVRGLAGATNR